MKQHIPNINKKVILILFFTLFSNIEYEDGFLKFTTASCKAQVTHYCINCDTEVYTACYFCGFCIDCCSLTDCGVYIEGAMVYCVGCNQEFPLYASCDMCGLCNALGNNCCELTNSNCITCYNIVNQNDYCEFCNQCMTCCINNDCCMNSCTTCEKCCAEHEYCNSCGNCVNCCTCGGDEPEVCSCCGSTAHLNCECEPAEPCECCGEEPCVCNKCSTCGKIIPASGTTQSLKSTNTSCELCNCQVSVSISIQGNHAIGENYDVIVFLSSSTYGFNVKIEMKASWESNWHIVYDALEEGSSCSYERKARTSGVITYKVTTTEINTSRTATDETITSEEYPDYNAIISDAGVNYQMNATWEATKNLASENGRQEKGFWIYYNTQTNQYEFEHVPDGSVVDCEIGTGGSVSPGSPSSVIPAMSSQDYPKPYVAFFHTHTPLTYCEPFIGRPTGPSPDSDIPWANSNKIPGFAYDYSVNELFGEHDINASANIYHFGYNRRPTREN